MIAMKIDFIQDARNPLLDRREVIASVTDYGQTPSRTELVAELSKKTGSPAEAICITRVVQSYGAKKAVVSVNFYDSAAALAKHVHKKLMRSSGKKKVAKKE